MRHRIPHAAPEPTTVTLGDVIELVGLVFAAFVFVCLLPLALVIFVGAVTS